MPLVAYKDLPSFQRLQDEGRTVLSSERALGQEIRELHIGLLNMMPDAALQATERQFFRLVGESNQIVQIYMHPFSLPELERSDETKAYIAQHYESFEKLQDDGLDALIITGANVSDPDLSKAEFWEPLQGVMNWAWDHVASTLCSCLATHALMQFRYRQTRQPLPAKRWGVYKHRVLDRQHPIMRGVNTVFDVPHSRHNAISRAQFEDAGLKVLSVSDEDDVHIAVSADGFRHFLFQGHPEYDTVSLYKEYKRDALLYADGSLSPAPPFPEGYMHEDLQNLMNRVKAGEADWPEDAVLWETIENSWADSARSIVGNWMGLVYQLTHVQRQKTFMDGVDPDNPLAGL